MTEHSAPSLGAKEEVLQVSGKGVWRRQGGTISCPRNPLAGARSLQRAGGEEEAGAGVERLLGRLQVEGEKLAAGVLLAARPACGDVR